MAPSLRFHSVLDLACEQSAVRWSREHARAVLREWDVRGDAAYDALTIVAELASNAVRHAGLTTRSPSVGCGQPRQPRCELTLWVVNSRLYISMYDESAHRPVLRPLSADSETGRGLHMINGLSNGAWGFHPATRGPGKVVWAALRLEAGVPTTAHAAGRTGTGERGKWGAGFRDDRAAHRFRLNRTFPRSLYKLRRLTWRVPLHRSPTAHDAHPPSLPLRSSGLPADRPSPLDELPSP